MSIFAAISIPINTPKNVPIIPVSAPCNIKISNMLSWLAPIVRKIAMSDFFSVTPITNVETILNAATAMMRVRIIDITFFSS